CLAQKWSVAPCFHCPETMPANKIPRAKLSVSSSDEHVLAVFVWLARVVSNLYVTRFEEAR
ncbi:MAG TPA: hypothetical protein VEI73_08255, partial [Candidatus Acidoferrum sp.]|nr:hypothetical protein [Candidatus Acidoferrum sp.]